jgi:hypothetical protein
MRSIKIHPVFWLLGLFFCNSRAAEIAPQSDHARAERNQKVLAKWAVHLDARYFIKKPIFEQFNSGDFSLLDKLASEKQINELFRHLSATMSATYGESIYPIPSVNDPFIKSTTYELNERFGAKVREQVRLRLSAITGHTDFLVGGIEEASKLIGGNILRSSNLRFLGEVGSMEAMQQLGRYLFDDRNLEGPDFYPDDACGVNRQPQPNSNIASIALQHALGDAAPPPRNQMNVGEMRVWWKSDAARPYREWNFDDYEPMPPPRKRAASLMPPSLPTRHPPISTASVEVDSNRTVAWPVIVILCLVSLAAILGFTKLKRGV